MHLVNVSDLHLDARTYGVERYAEVVDGLQQAVDHAIGVRADVFTCLGDVCNPGTPRAPRAIAACVAVARRLSDAGIASWWMSGNHDVVEDGSGAHTLLPLREARLPGCRVIDRPGLYPLDAACSMQAMCLPYTPLSHDYDPEREVRACAEVAILPPVVVLGHLDVEGYGGGSEAGEMARGRSMVWPVDAIRECWPRALMIGGHVHQGGLHGGVEIVGSPARFTAAEAAHVPGWLDVEL